MSKTKKFYLGNSPIGGSISKSRKMARKITSNYHKFVNQIAAIESINASKAHKNELKKKISSALGHIGGLDAYQKASIVSTQYFNTSKWILKILKKLIESKSVSYTTSKPLLLEVGAINPYIAKTNWVESRSIDILSQHSLIEEYDFFDINPTQSYDVVVCSMVINCLPSPLKRTEMLFRLIENIHDKGVLFLVLPIACVNSRHVGMRQFESLLFGIGCFEIIPKRVTPKLIFYTLGKHTINDIDEVAPIRADDDKTSLWKNNICTRISRWMSEHTLNHFRGSKNSGDCNVRDDKIFRLHYDENLIQYNKNII